MEKKFVSTELDPNTHKVFGTYPIPQDSRQVPLFIRLNDGTTLIEEFPTGGTTEEQGHITNLALEAAFRDKPDYFK